MAKVKVEAKEAKSEVKNDRKSYIKRIFIDNLKAIHADRVFRTTLYLDSTGRGILPDKFADVKDSDYPVFQEIVKELADSGDFEHLGTDTYNNIKIK